MKSTYRRNYRIPALLLGLSVSIALTGCKKEDEAAAAEAAKNAVLTVGAENVVIAANGSIMTGPQISGTLEPERKAVMRAEMGGRVLQTYAEQGQSVNAGTVLARIDATGIQDAYNSARSGVTAARNAYDVASRDLARNQKLLDAGAIAERDIDLSRRAAIAAQAALEDANSRLAAAQRQLRSTQITAPFSGVVSERPVSAGDVVQPGAHMFTVVEPSSMQLEASVPAEQLASIRVGVPVTFTVSGYPGRQFLGTITRINPTADPMTRQVRIYVSIPNAGRTLVGGLFANGRMSSTTKMGLIVPTAAVDVRGAAPTAMRIRKGKVEKVQVQLGITDKASESVEVIAGIQVGDTLLLGAAQGITPGTAVRVSAPVARPVATSGD